MSNLIPQAKQFSADNSAKLSLTRIRHIDAAQGLKELAIKHVFSKVAKKESADKIMTIRIDDSLPNEGYKINVDNTGIHMIAKDYSGVLYGLQTIRVLAEVDVQGSLCEMAHCEIVDYPKNSWRGLMLDESRHFFGEKSVKRLLELMSLHKLNIFHWHLTDDQGWRIEIKKYPKLTEIGSRRTRTQINGWGSSQWIEEVHEGFYTQSQIKDIVKYAGSLGIMVVPEVDMPAHFTAAFAAYPSLACREVDTEVLWYFGSRIPNKLGIKDWYRSACIGKAETMEFIHGVLTEVFALFPAPYFHIGGDEAPKGEWEKCEHCKKYMRDNNIANTNELQCDFINNINKFAKKHGKTLIGWNEVLEGGKLDNNVLVQYWTIHKDKRVIEHLKQDGKIIMTKHKPFYFDMSHAQYNYKQLFEFDEHVEGIDNSFDNQIVGMEAPLWTEFVPTQDKMDMQLFPRVCSLAEICWGNEQRNFKEFSARLNSFKSILDGMGVWYAEDKVAMPSFFAKKRRHIAWYTGNTELEYKLNKKLKDIKIK